MSDVRLLRVNPSTTFCSSSTAFWQRLIRSVAYGGIGIKAHISRVVRGAAQHINLHAEEAASEGFNSANVAQIPQSLNVKNEVFSVGGSCIAVFCSVAVSRRSRDFYSSSGK